MGDAPCEWPVIWPDALHVTDEERAQWGPIAAQIIWALSGRQYGRCRAWVRPFPAPAGARCSPHIVQGRWLNSAGRGTLLELPRPTLVVHELRVGSENGAVTLPSTSYRKIGDALLRIDGEPWPPQDPAAQTGEPGWWAVDITTGFPVPLGGQIAAGLLAGELLKARRGGKCRLPARAQSVAREGVDVTLLDPAALYEAGLTGLAEVDQWITAVNPARLRTRPSVSSPDHPLRGLRAVE